MQTQQITSTPRRQTAALTDGRLRRSRKANAEVILGAPGALRRLLNGAPVALTDPDIADRLRAVRDNRSAHVSSLFLEDIEGALVAARWAQRFGRRA